MGMHFFDSFSNFLAGFGVFGRDKAMHQQYALRLLTMKEQVEAYRGDWLSRKIVDIPAFDSTRQWRAWQADEKQIGLLEAEERKFNVQQKLQQALIRARLFGGAAIVIGVDQGEFNEPLDVDKIGQGDLKWVHVVQRWMLQAGPIVRDISSPWFGEPAWYMRTNIVTPTSTTVPVELPKPDMNIPAGAMITIHPSRVIRLLGNAYPDPETATDQWGDSVLQTVHDAIRDAGLVGQSIAAMVAEAKLDVIKIPSLNEILSTTTGSTKLFNRFANANVAKSVINTILIDEKEDWDRKEIHPEGLPKVLESYLMVASAAADIPATRLLGKSPDGMNSTGESDIRNYYDRLKSEQETQLTPALSKLDEVLIRSALGRRDPSVHYNWNSLWQPTVTEKADIALKKAQTFQVDVMAGLINPEALRIGRQNQLIEDGTYPGLETTLEDLSALEAMDHPEDVRFENQMLEEEARRQQLLSPPEEDDDGYDDE